MDDQQPASTSAETTDTGQDLDRNPEDDAIHALRALLLADDRAAALDLARQVDDLREQIQDDESLIRRVNPILGEAIRRKIRDSREEMIEALYPIIGQLVLRAVSEAMRDLARTIDARMRQTISPQSLARRAQAQIRGVSGADVMLRDALPFAINEIFLIHRPTGILLYHTSARGDTGENTGEQSSAAERVNDSDVISGMLTAIQDFVRDAFVDTTQSTVDSDLDEIQYGDASIFLETARYAYIAVVASGVEPAGFRGEMRQSIVKFNLANEHALAKFDGNTAKLTALNQSLEPLLVFMPAHSLGTAEPGEPINGAASRWLPAVLGLLGIILVVWLLIVLLG